MNHRAAVGPKHNYDIIGALQFCVMIMLGLRENHTLLDIGCGSLRGGKFFVQYLQPGNYYGIEPDRDLVDAGIIHELGGEQTLFLKGPTFHYNGNFDITHFGRQFDFLLAQSIFSHTSRAQMKKCMGEAGESMHKNSLFVATYMPGADYMGDSWRAGGSCATYGFETIRSVAKGAGLYVRLLDMWHPSGQRWIAMGKVHNNIQIAVGRARRWRL